MNRHIEALKKNAARYAVRFIQPGMILGLGHGSTARFALHEIAALFSRGTLPRILGIPCSAAVGRAAAALNIPLTTLDAHPEIDLTIDGADEITLKGFAIKGGGGALLHEKIVAQASRRMILIADETKLSPVLGTRFPVPVEVVPFGMTSHLKYLERQGCRPVLRKEGDLPFRTDEGNCIIDCHCGPLEDPHALALKLKERAGMVEHGLFLDLATDIVLSGQEGIRHIPLSVRHGGPS